MNSSSISSLSITRASDCATMRTSSITVTDIAMRTRRPPGSQRCQPVRVPASAVDEFVAEAMDIHHLGGRVVAEGATQGVQHAAQVVAAVLLMTPYGDLELAPREHALGLRQQFGRQAQGLGRQRQRAAL